VARSHPSVERAEGREYGLDRGTVRGLQPALGHIACRRAHCVLALRADKILRALKHARLDNSYEVELRKLLACDLLIVDDFALDTMDAIESRDVYEIIIERHRARSMIFTSNRGSDEWLATFSDALLAQSAVDRFTGNAYDLLIDGESYRQRLEPGPARAKMPAPGQTDAH